MSLLFIAVTIYIAFNPSSVLKFMYKYSMLSLSIGICILMLFAYCCYIEATCENVCAKDKNNSKIDKV